MSDDVCPIACGQYTATEVVLPERSAVPYAAVIRVTHLKRGGIGQSSAEPTSPTCRREGRTHVLYFHQYFVPPGGAGGTRSLENARRLVEAGYRVTLVTTDAFFPEGMKAVSSVDTRVVGGIELRVIRLPYSNHLSNVRRVLAFVRYAVRATVEGLRSDRPDVIFATSTPLTVAIPGLITKVLRHRPLVFEVRDLWPEMPIAVGALRNPILIVAARALEWCAYHSSYRIVALSPGMAAGVVKRGIPESAVEVIPNAADLMQFGDEVASKERFHARHSGFLGTRIIAYAGTFGRLNDVEFLIRAVAYASGRDPSVRLVLCGDGQRKRSAEELAERLGVMNSVVHFLAPMSKRDVADLFAASMLVCCVFVPIPEMASNSANKFFDGLASGRPVLINYGGWQAELLLANAAGVVVDPNDAEAAGNEIARLCEDPQECARLGRGARALAEAQFDRDRLFEKLRTVIDTAACNWDAAAGADGSRHEGATQ